MIFAALLLLLVAFVISVFGISGAFTFGSTLDTCMLMVYTIIAVCGIACFVTYLYMWLYP